MPTFGLIANLENRRARFFCDAVAQFGASTVCVSWTDLLKTPGTSLRQLAACDLVRVDSAGENAAVASALLALGGVDLDEPLAFGQLAHVDAQHRGLTTALRWISEAGLPCINPPEDIESMFDKWKTHERLVEAGIDRPQTRCLPNPPTKSNGDDIADALDIVDGNEPEQRLFAKPRYGSSAAGVCALWRHRTGTRLIAPIELGPPEAANYPKLFNTLRVRSYTERAEINVILDSLLAQGMIAEHWIPKASLAGLGFDFRVVTINGQARHTVIRQSHHPMTNLHLGNRRGSTDDFLRVYGADTLKQVKKTAEEAARCFPRSMVVGVDILLDQGGQTFVLELNAFGDLLPGITSRSQSTYQAIVETMVAHLKQPKSKRLDRSYA